MPEYPKIGSRVEYALHGAMFAPRFGFIRVVSVVDARPQKNRPLMRLTLTPDPDGEVNPENAEVVTMRQVLSITPPDGKSHSVCGDCGANNPELFMIHDATWLSVAERDELLCFDCTERRLERDITWHDLKPCGLTRTMEMGVKIHGRG